MKHLLKYISLFLLPAFCACSSDERFEIEPQQPARQALTIHVSAGDFITYGESGTRATDNGTTITFDNGDCVGIIALDVSGNIIADNVPYTYNGNSWAFDAQNTEGKQPCYYDTRVKTYIVYYPYSPLANGKKTQAELKNLFSPQTDQRTLEAYRVSDLMIGSTSPGTPSRSIEVNLTHAYASVVVQPEVMHQLQDGSNTLVSISSSRISDVSFAIGDNVYFPVREEDGSYRCILPDNHNAIRCFYTLYGDTYRYTITIQSAFVSNTRYISKQKIDGGSYDFDMVHIGDFYIKSADGYSGYLIPGEVASPLSEEVKAACLGIVYWKGDPTNTTNGDPLLARDKSGCTHGLVVALHETKQPSAPAAAKMKWSVSYEQVNNWTNHNDRGGNKVDILEQNRYQGYANTVALKAYYAQQSNAGLKVLPISAIEQYSTDYPAPSNSSGWYVPSIMELKYMCWGQGNSQSTTGRDLLNGQFAKVGGTNFDSSWYYWSSSEYAGYSSRAWYVRFYDGHVGYYDKNGREFWVRALFAF